MKWRLGRLIRGARPGGRIVAERGLSDMSPGSYGKGFDVISEKCIGQGRSLLDAERYPALVILLLAFLAGNGGRQVAMEGVQDVVAGHRQEMRVRRWQDRNDPVAARYVGIAVVVVAATVVFVVERQRVVVMMLAGAVAYVEAGRRGAVVMVMREQQQALCQNAQDKDNFHPSAFP